jgi:hypothetical protein
LLFLSLFQPLSWSLQAHARVVAEVVIADLAIVMSKEHVIVMAAALGQTCGLWILVQALICLSLVRSLFQAVAIVVAAVMLVRVFGHFAR